MGEHGCNRISPREMGGHSDRRALILFLLAILVLLVIRSEADQDQDHDQEQEYRAVLRQLPVRQPAQTAPANPFYFLRVLCG
jgi:hypothetical protein